MTDTVHVHPAEARRRFREFAEQPIDLSNLAYGALLIALEEYPDLSVETSIAKLDAIGGRIEAAVVPTEPEIFRLGHVNREMFDVEKFGGNQQRYYDARNSYLNEVIDRKLGIPITLSIVFLHLAHRAGLRVVGVGLPGHFIVKATFEMSEVYIDPFHQGAMMSVRDIGNLLAEQSGGEMRLRSEHLRAWSGRETLARVLANLESIYEREGNRRKVGIARERIELLSASASVDRPGGRFE